MAATIQKILTPTKPRAVDTSTSYQIVSQNLVSGDSANFASGVGIWEGVRGTLSHNSSNAKFTTDNAYHEDANTMSTYPIGMYDAQFFNADTGPGKDWAEQGQMFKVKFKAKYSSTSNLDAAVPFNYIGNTSNQWVAIKNPNMTNDWQDYEFNVFRTWSQTSFYLATTNVSGLDAVSGQEDVFFYDDIEIYAMEPFSNNNHGQIYSGRGLEFDGVADRLVSQEDYPYYDENSIAFWFNPDDLSGTEGIIGRNSGSASTSSWSIWYNSGNINCYVGDTSSFDHASYDVPAANTWYRVVAVFDHPNNNVKIYVNGVLAAEDTNSFTYADIVSTGADDIIIGALSSSSFFAGKLSDVQIWNKVWTQSDVTFDYLNPESLALNNSGTSLAESNLKIWYPMNNGHRGQQSYILDGANRGLGPNLVTDGDLSSGTTSNFGNSNGTSTFEISTDKVYTGVYSLHIKDDTAYRGVFQNISTNLISGVTYKASARVWVVSGAVRMEPTDGISINATHVLSTTTGQWELIECFFTVDAESTETIYFGRTWGGAGEFYIDDMKLESVNDKHHATTVFYGDDGWNKADNYVDTGTNKWDPSLVSNVTTSPSGGTTIGSDIAVISTGGGQDAAHMGINIIPGVSSNGIGILLNNTTSGTLSSTMGDMVVGRNYRLSYSATTGSNRDTANIAVNNGSSVTTGSQNVRFNEGTTTELGGKVLNGDFNDEGGSASSAVNWTQSTDADRETSGGHSTAEYMSLETTSGPTENYCHQTITGLTAGEQYLLTFWAKGGGSTSQSIRIRVQYDGSNVNLSTTDTGWTTATWKKFNYQFTASHTSAIVYFYSPTVVGTVALDDVKVSKFEDAYIDFMAGHATNAYLYGKDMTTPDPTTSSTDIWNTSLTSNTTGWNTYLGGSIDGADGGGTDDGAMKCIRNEADGSNDLYFTRSDTITFEPGYKYKIQAGIRIPTSTDDYQASAGNAYITVDGIDGTVTAQRKALQASERNSYTTVVTLLDLTSNDSSSDNTGKLLVRSDSALADDDFIHLKDVNVYRLEDIFLDNITFKEIGTATGWTDVDQQLDIPQTALQSYNQLAWFGRGGDSVSIPDTNDLSFTNDSTDSPFSISAWIYVSQRDNGFYIFTKGGYSSYHKYEYVLNVENDGDLKFLCHDGAIADSASNHTAYAGRVTNDQPISMGKWHHVVSTYNGSDNPHDDAKLYINGEEASHVSATSDNPSAYQFMKNQALTAEIGKKGVSGSYGDAGCVTELSVWDTELSASHVKELYNDGEPLDARLHSVYILDSTELKCYLRNNGLAVWQDLSSFDNDGTPNSSVVETLLLPAGVDASRDNQGFLMNRQKDTNSLNFSDANGSQDVSVANEYVEIPRDSSIDDIWAGGGSISCWIKPSSDGENNGGRIFQKGTYIQAGSESGGKLKLTMQVPFSSTNGIWTSNENNSGRVINIGEWNHIVITYNSDATSNDPIYYINNATEGHSEQTPVGSVTTDNTTNAIIGNSSSSGIRQFDGQIDDMLIYSDILSADEVDRIYKAGKRSHR